MQLEDLADRLLAHEHASKSRHETTQEQVQELRECLKHIHHHLKESDMSVSDKINVNLGEGLGGAGLAGLAPLLAAGSGGFGGNNAIWPIVLLALLGRNGGGLFGGDGNGGGSAVNQITLGQIQSALGDIKASVPLAESQVQLALAGAQSDITSQNMQQTIALQQQNFAGQLANCNSFAQTGDKIDNVSTQQAVGFGVIGSSIQKQTFDLSQVVQNDGEKTRALISSIDRDNLNRIITTQANEITELQADQRSQAARHGVEINMINNQNQNQLQFQQQAQAIGQLAHLLADVSQVARATNQNLIVGNTGATTTGAQTANPVNVRA